MKNPHSLQVHATTTAGSLPRTKKRRHVVSSWLISATLLLSAGTLSKANGAIDVTWTGLGSDNSWETAENWDSFGLASGDILHFAGAIRPNTNNSTTNLGVGGLYFDSGADSFTLNGSQIALHGNVVNNSANIQTINLAMNLGAVTRTFDAATGEIAVRGLLSGSGGIIKNGANLLSIDKANSGFSGGITINAGTLAVDTSNPFGAATSVVMNGGTLNLRANTAPNSSFAMTVSSLSGSGGSITKGTGTGVRTFTVDSSTNDTFGGTIDGGTGLAFVKAGSGSLTLTAENALSTGSTITTVNGGRLILGTGNALASTQRVTIGSNYGLGFSEGVTNVAFGEIRGAGALRLENEAGAAVNLTLSSASTFDGALEGSGTLTVTNAVGQPILTGALKLSGGLTASTVQVLILRGDGTDYTGKTTITRGALRVDSATALGSSGEIIFDGGSLDFTANNATDYSSRFATLAGGKNADIQVWGEHHVTFASAIKGAGGLTLQRNGTLALTSGNSDYTGGTVITVGGTLEVAALNNGGANSSIGKSAATASNLQLNGTLRYTGTGGSTDRLFQIGALGTTLESSGTGAIEFTGTGAIGYTALGAGNDRSLTLGGTNTGLNTIAPIIANKSGGTTTLTKSGVGTWVLAGANTYTGKTTVTGGKLIVNGSIASSSEVTLNAGTELGGSGIVSLISGAGRVGPGNSPGILTATDGVNGADGLDFTFEFTLKNTAPIFNNSTASGNDVLRLMGATPFSTSLTAANEVTLDFRGVSGIASGDHFLGGFYTDLGSDFMASIQNATYLAIGLGDDWHINVSTIAQMANFDGHDVNGYITRFEVIRADVIPEPGTNALLLLTGASLWLLVHRARRQPRGASDFS